MVQRANQIDRFRESKTWLKTAESNEIPQLEAAKDCDCFPVENGGSNLPKLEGLGILPVNLING